MGALDCRHDFIVYVLPSISKKLLDDSINFARQHIQIKGEGEFSCVYYPTRKKIAPLQQGNSMVKEKHQPF